MKTFSSSKKFDIFVIIVYTQCEYVDAQGCQLYTPMLQYNRNEISNLVVVTHLVAPISMVGPIKDCYNFSKLTSNGVSQGENMQQCYNKIVVKGYHVELFMLCVLFLFVV